MKDKIHCFYCEATKANKVCCQLVPLRIAEIERHESHLAMSAKKFDVFKIHHEASKKATQAFSIIKQYEQ